MEACCPLSAARAGAGAGVGGADASQTFGAIRRLGSGPRRRDRGRRRDDLRVALELASAAQAILGVEADKIQILKMEDDS
jgi:hypothetical protein